MRTAARAIDLLARAEVELLDLEHPDMRAAWAKVLTIRERVERWRDGLELAEDLNLI